MQRSTTHMNSKGLCYHLTSYCRGEEGCKGGEGDGQTGNSVSQWPQMPLKHNQGRYGKTTVAVNANGTFHYNQFNDLFSISVYALGVSLWPRVLSVIEGNREESSSSINVLKKLDAAKTNQLKLTWIQRNIPQILSGRENLSPPFSTAAHAHDNYFKVAYH